MKIKLSFVQNYLINESGKQWKTKAKISLFQYSVQVLMLKQKIWYTILN